MNTLLERLRRPALRTAACSSLALLCAPLALAQSTAPTVSEVLARANEALGWERVVAHPGAVRVRGAARVSGTDAVQTDVFDGRGRWLHTLEGPLPRTGGFDGETDWIVDATSTPRILELGDAVEAQMTADLLYGSWAAPGSELLFASVSTEGDQQVLEFTSRGGHLQGVMYLDASSYLPRSASWDDLGQSTTWTFEGFEEHDGYRFPARVSIEHAGLVQTFATGAVELLEESDEALFAPRLERPQDTRFDDQVSPVLEVKRVRTGHLLVHPLIDGQDLGWFIFDSGAGANCISTSVAQRLGGAPVGEVVAQGIGGAVISHYWRAEQLQLGPLTIEDPVFLGLDLEFLNQPFGVEVGGIIGYELLARCTAEFDQVTPYIALFDPQAYLLAQDGSWEDVMLLGGLPCVRASFEGHEGVFKIDTGAAGDTVTLHAPATSKLALLEDRETRAGQAGGVGGMVTVREGELTSFRLGGHDFGAIPASFALEEKGAFNDPYVWGNLGGRLFEPFLLVFDYPHRRVGFVLK